MVIRIHGRDTGDAVAVVESHDVPGGGPPCTCHSMHSQEGGCKSVNLDGQQRDIVRETLGFASAF